MKKNTTGKTNTVKKTAPRAKKTTARTVNVAAQPAPRTSSWSISVYIYWFIILFFIAATFYILGRNHGMVSAPVNNVEITEEKLMQSSDYYNSGKTKVLAGDTDAAIADLSAAISADDKNIDAYILRGESYMQSGDYKNALSDFNQAIELDGKSAIAYYDRALLNTRLENYQAALNDINNALAANTENPTPMLQMRDLYARRGQLNLWLKNWQGAVADYTNSLARPDGVVSPTVYAERAEAYTAIGNYQAAIDDYSSAVRVISEQIQGAASAADRESLSSNAMSYFEKSAALNLQLGNVDAARGDLESSYTIAMALNDTETADRLQTLIQEMNAQ
ncbi:tetratricopeptide repeat protein [bacterium]|nr:tetratricopeptide repeat protein [bacterium]